MRIPPLNHAQSTVLRAVEAGGRIQARRTYPFPHRFELCRKNEFGFGSSTPAATVSLLVTMGLVRPIVLDREKDSIDYRITASGKRAVKNGTAEEPPATQLTLLEEGAA